MIDELTKNLKQCLGGRCPQTLIILGSGLGCLSDDLTDKRIVGYDEVGFPKSSVSGHVGQLVMGKLGDKEVICMRGRFHLYEGHEPQLIKNIMCAFASIGIEELIVTNAAGSLRADMSPGSLMLITDHINLSGRNPLVGMNDEKYGPRFPDMGNVYDKTLREKICRVASQHQIPLSKGVYCMVLGPNFETAAEVKAFRLLGAHAVGMSTVPEVISAVYAGIKVLGLSVITNFGTGIQTKPLSHAETLLKAGEASQKLSMLLQLYLKE